MPINEYTEKEIRNKIINKVNPSIKKGRSKHQKGRIFIDGKVVARVKIPNDHDRTMKESKTQYIASALRLTHEEFNGLIDCPITGPKYYKILKKTLKKTKNK